MSTASIHVVIVAYGAEEKLDRSLTALERAFPTLVVDNSSSGAVAAVAERHGAAYVDAGENRGFAAAVNVALARLADEGGDVLLLNPDAELSPGGVRDLQRFLRLPASERVAAVSPRLQDADGAEQRVIWPFPSPARMCAEAVGLGRLPARHTFAVGAVLLLRRRAIEQVGLFDERFFLYAEETDWQRRARRYGWSSAVCASVVARHDGAGMSTSPQRREALFHAAHEIYIRKWYGRAGWWLYRAAACAGAAARAVVLSGTSREDAVRRLGLYVRGPRRCAAVAAE